MEKIHKNIRVFMLSCIKHACFHVFSPFSAYFFPHYIVVEKGLLLSDPAQLRWGKNSFHAYKTPLMRWLSQLLSCTLVNVFSCSSAEL